MINRYDNNPSEIQPAASAFHEAITLKQSERVKRVEELKHKLGLTPNYIIGGDADAKKTNTIVEEQPSMMLNELLGSEGGGFNEELS